jgi:anti-sigma B factor antagonist
VNNAIRVAVEGELGIFTATTVREQLLQAFDSAAVVEWDLGSVTEIDSAGIQLILAARKEALARGKGLRLAACSQPVAEIVDLCGLTGDIDELAPEGEVA